jgi:hypothetical protein
MKKPLLRVMFQSSSSSKENTGIEGNALQYMLGLAFTRALMRTVCSLQSNLNIKDASDPNAFGPRNGFVILRTGVIKVWR